MILCIYEALILIIIQDSSSKVDVHGLDTVHADIKGMSIPDVFSSYSAQLGAGQCVCSSLYL